MEDLRRAAVAYYSNSSPEIQALVWNFFNSMDTDGDGRVSVAEFSNFVYRSGYSRVDWDLFGHLDMNRDGCLDFWEVLAFYYILKTRALWCGNCQVQLHTLYFTCVQCFDSGKTFDLCSTCYSSRGFHHEHRGLFLDSFVLLRSKVGVSPGTNINQAISQPQNDHSDIAISQPQNDHSDIDYWFMALETVMGVANICATLSGCSIM